MLRGEGGSRGTPSALSRFRVDPGVVAGSALARRWTTSGRASPWWSSRKRAGAY
jgi:hypothetical protein